MDVNPKKSKYIIHEYKMKIQNDGKTYGIDTINRSIKIEDVVEFFRRQEREINGHVGSKRVDRMIKSALDSRETKP